VSLSLSHGLAPESGMFVAQIIFLGAIAGGEFNDSDAEAVRGLDDLGGPRVYAGNVRAAR
jgi:hypothetical protein